MKFSDFRLNPALQRGLDESGYIECTPVQAVSLQAALIDKRDIYAQSQTGTGKTAAFLVPVLQMLSENNHQDEFALVLTPTRELALQVEKEAKLLGKYLSLKIVHILGGVEYAGQEKGLKSQPRLIIGTPGRLQDFANQGILNLQKTKYLIVDEADRMFDMGFQNDVLALMSAMPPRTERVSFLFSATLNAKVGNLVWEHMNNPVDIVIEPEQVTVDAIDQEIYHVGRSEKMQLLFALIRHYQPRNIIIFSNTKVGAAQIAKFFDQMGMTCGVLEGNMPQAKRTRVINNLISGKLCYLAATDVAARGLHVPNLDWVVNFDLPNEAENYVHRIGRTARAGCTGKAISFACERYVYNLSAIENLIAKKIPIAWPSSDLQALMTTIESELKEARKKAPHSEGPHEGRPKKGQGHAKKNKRHEQSPAKHEHAAGQVKPKNKPPRDHHSPHERPRHKDKQISGEKKPRHPHSKYKFDKKKPYTGAEGNKGECKPQRSVEERMAYYQEKYGENFKPSARKPEIAKHNPHKGPTVQGKEKKKKEGLFDRLLSIFKKKE